MLMRKGIFLFVQVRARLLRFGYLVAALVAEVKNTGLQFVGSVENM